MNRLLFVLILMMIFSGCGKNAYEKSIEIGTEDSYKEFILNNPDDKRIEHIRAKLDSLIYQRTIQERKTEAYEYYLKLIPAGFHSDEIRAKLWELEFKEAKMSSSREKMQAFINKYPEAPQIEEAKTLLRELEAKEELIKAKEKNTEDAFISVIEKYPETSSGKEAKELLAEFRWLTALNQKTPGAISEFLKKESSPEYLIKAFNYVNKDIFSFKESISKLSAEESISDYNKGMLAFLDIFSEKNMNFLATSRKMIEQYSNQIKRYKMSGFEEKVREIEDNFLKLQEQNKELERARNICSELLLYLKDVNNIETSEIARKIFETYYLEK